MLVPIAALALLAAGNPDPAALLECWAKAVGGRDRLAKVQAVEREGTLATPGDKGTFHSWTRADGASHEQGTFGPSTWTTAFDGRRRWVLDGAAPVYDSAGVELQQAITEAYVASFSMLVPGRMPGEVRAGPGPSSLVLAPAGGREWAVALDPKTCLPRTFTYPGGDRTITVTLQKWAAFGGVLMPVASEQSDGDPETLMRIRVERTRVDAPFPDSLLARPEWKASVKIPAGQSPVTLPLELAQNHPYSRLTVNGQGPVWMLLDTGSSGAIMDSERAAALGLKGKGGDVLRGAGAGKLKALTVAHPELGWGPLKIPGEVLTTAPLKALSLREGRAMEGIFGWQTLSQFVVELDYAGPAVRLHDPDAFQVPAGAAVVPFILLDSHPLVEATLELGGGKTLAMKAIIDTGSRGALSLSRPFVSRNHLVEAAGKTLDAPLGFGVGGRTEQVLARFPALRLGEVRVEAPVVSLAHGGKGAEADVDMEGIIGGDVLRRFTVYLDYKRSRLALVKNADFGTPFEYDMSGMLLVSADQQFKRVSVSEVVPGSPAAEAGVKAGDEVQRVDGQPVEQEPVEALRRRLRAPGVKVELRLLRGGKPVDVTLTTRRLI